MASIRKNPRTGNWEVRYRDGSGSQRTLKATDNTRGGAKALAATIEVDQMRGEWIDPRSQRVTVAELGERLIATKRDRNTRAWNRSMLRHVNERWSDTPIAAVDHLDVQTWIAELETAGVGVDSIRGAFRVLHEVVQLAARARILRHDPCLGVRLPKVRRREMLFLSPAQVNLLADELDAAAPGHAWGVLVRFAAYSGCRAGEVGGLRVENLDLLRHRCRIVGARKTYGEDGETKTGKPRWIDLPRQLCEELAAQLAARSASREDRVWTGERGAPLNHHWFYVHRYRPAVERLTERGLLPSEVDVDGDPLLLRFHDLRHTCVALLIAKGAQQYEVMEHLGHTNIQTTINTYGHLFPSVRERIRSALEDTWDEARTAS